MCRYPSDWHGGNILISTCLATTLNEIGSSNVGILIHEKEVPVRDSVKGACEILGLDPLYVANEGKLCAIVAPQVADIVLAKMHAHPYGRDSRLIGDVIADIQELVLTKTAIGATRVDVLLGDQLPRIC